MSGAWTFSSSVLTPTGALIETTISIPEERYHKDLLELTEIAQMGLCHAVNAIRRGAELRPNEEKSPTYKAVFGR